VKLTTYTLENFEQHKLSIYLELAYIVSSLGSEGAAVFQKKAGRISTIAEYGNIQVKNPIFRSWLASQDRDVPSEFEWDNKNILVGIPLMLQGQATAYLALIQRRSFFNVGKRLDYGLFSKLCLLLEFEKRKQLVGSNEILAKKEELTNNFLSSLLDRSEQKSAFEKTLQFLLELFNCKEGTIWEYHDNRQFKVASYLTLEATSKEPLTRYTYNCLPERHGLVWQSLLPGAPKLLTRNEIQITDLANTELLSDYQNKTILLLRLEVANRIYGVACLAGLDTSNIETLGTAFQTFEKMAALEVHNKITEHKCEVLEKVVELVPAINSDLRQVCEAAVKNVLQIIGCQGVSIFLKPDLDETAKTLILVASEIDQRYVPSEALRGFRKGKVIEYGISDNSVTGAIAYYSKPIISNSISELRMNSHKFREIEDAKNDTWIGVPVFSADGSCLGVLRCTGKQSTIGKICINYIFDGFDLRALTLFAKTLSPLLETIKGVRALNDMNKRLAESERIREHEMTAPLAVISANADFVREHLKDEGVTSKPRRLREIISDAEMCAFLLKDPQVPKPEVFKETLSYLSINNVVIELVKFLQRQIEQRSRLEAHGNQSDLEMIYEIPPFMSVDFSGRLPNTVANKHLLQRALYNLGINAVKYGIPHGKLLIELTEDPAKDLIYIKFKDDGIGIDPEDVSHLFVAGYRGVRVRDTHSGEGLGLNLAKAIIMAHKGTIELISAEKPTVFLISLPIIKKRHTEATSTSHPLIIRMDKAKPL
jgi:signal transduction histidine kinase